MPTTSRARAWRWRSTRAGVTRKLERIAEFRGRWSTILGDDGDDLSSNAVIDRSAEAAIERPCVAPGIPMHEGGRREIRRPLHAVGAHSAAAWPTSSASISAIDWNSLRYSGRCCDSHRTIRALASSFLT